MKKTKKVNLSRHKFYTLFTAGTISFAVSTIAGFLDNIVSGNFLGEAAISAVGLVTPIFTIVCFISTLFANGAANYYTEAVGEFDKKKAYEIFGTAIIASIALGVIMMVSLFFLEDAIINWFGVGEEISDYCHQYFKYFILLSLIQPMDWLLFAIVYNDGDQNCTIVSDVFKVGTNIIFAIIFCSLMGVAGVSLARVISTVIAMIILCCHFFRKQNSLKVRFVFKTKYCPTIVKYSAVIAFGYLFTAILNMAMNEFVIEMFGEFYIPVVNVIMFVFSIITVCSSNGTAITPFVCVYLSEKNMPGLKNIMNAGLWVAIIEGVVITLLFMIFGDFVSVIYGITTPALVDMASVAIRWASVCIVFASIIYLYVQYYVVAGHAVLSVVFSGLFMTVAPIWRLYLFGYLWGQIPGWAGWGLSFGLAFIICVIVVFIMGGKKKFPLLIDDFGTNTKNYNFVLSAEAFAEVNKEIVDFLKENNIANKSVQKASLLIEEMGVKIQDFNKDHKGKILIEISVQLDPQHPGKVFIVVRDNGKFLDVTDEDSAVTSLNSYMLASYMRAVQDKTYVKTIGFNRSHYEI